MIQENSQEECIKVMIRIRNKNNEKKPSTKFTISNNTKITTENDNKEPLSFSFDYIFNENSSQAEIFEHCGKNICDSALKGYNGTIFAYGQSGSGKTFTLLGKSITFHKKSNSKLTLNTSAKNITKNLNKTFIETDRKNLLTEESHFINYTYNINDQKIGLIPRIIYYLYNNTILDNNYTIKFSFIEIYNNQIKDLFDINNTKQIKINEINNQTINPVKKIIINNPEQAINLITEYNILRHTGFTDLNEHSSRSHAIISFYIEKNTNLKIKKSVFHVIDLAGSERQKKSNATDKTLKEAGQINKSLFLLSDVIQSIIDKKQHIPYRNCILTYMLKDSLGGNAKTCIIATISPFEKDFEETISTLRFAKNAKKVKNNVKINEEIKKNVNMKVEIEDLENIFDKILKEKNFLEEKVNSLEKNQINYENAQIKNLKEYNELKEQMDFLKKKSDEQNENNEKLEKENNILNVKIVDLNLIVEKKQLEIQKLKKEKSEINRTKNEILQGKKILERDCLKKISELNKILISMETENLKLKEQIDKNNKNISNYLETCRLKHTQYNLLEKEFEKLKNENLDLKTKIIENQNSENLYELSSNSKIAKNVEELIRQSQKIKNRSNSQLKETKNELDKYKRLIENFTKIIDKLFGKNIFEPTIDLCSNFKINMEKLLDLFQKQIIEIQNIKNENNKLKIEKSKNKFKDFTEYNNDENMSILSNFIYQERNKFKTEVKKKQINSQIINPNKIKELFG